MSMLSNQYKLLTGKLFCKECGPTIQSSQNAMKQRDEQECSTSGMSKICLTCMRLVMCHVYLEKEPNGRASCRTNAVAHRQIRVAMVTKKSP